MITYLGGVTDTSVDGGALSASLSGLGLQEGDIVIACVCCPTTSDIDLSISGYNEMCDLYTDYGSNYANFYAGYKIMGATPDSSVEVGAFGGVEAGNVLLVYAFRGVDTTTPLDVTPTTSVYSATTPIRPQSPPITPITSGAIVISSIMNTRTSNVITTSTDPVGYSDLVAAAVSDTRVCTAGICQKDWSGSGAETPGEWTIQYYDWAGITIALRPLVEGTDYFKTCSETIAINDTLLNKTSRVFTEAISIVDSIAIQKTLSRTLSEVITIVDNLNAKKIAVKTFSEIMSITDTIKKSIGKVLTETITIVDSIIFGKVFARTYSEVITIVDTIAMAWSKTFTDIITIADTITKKTAQILSEAITIVDSIATKKILSKALSEAITIVDTVKSKTAKTLSEVITIADSISKIIAQVLSETITLTESLYMKLNGVNVKWVRKYSEKVGSFTRKYSEKVGTFIKKYYKDI